MIYSALSARFSLRPLNHRPIAVGIGFAIVFTYWTKEIQRLRIGN